MYFGGALWISRVIVCSYSQSAFWRLLCPWVGLPASFWPVQSLLRRVADHVHTLLKHRAGLGGPWVALLVPGVLGPPPSFIWRLTSCDDGGRLCLLVLPHLSSSGAPAPGFILPVLRRDRHAGTGPHVTSAAPAPGFPWEPMSPRESVCPQGGSAGDQEMVHWGCFGFFFQPAEKVLCVCWINFVIFQVASFFSLNLGCPNYQLTSGGLIWETCILISSPIFRCSSRTFKLLLR